LRLVVLLSGILALLDHRSVIPANPELVLDDLHEAGTVQDPLDVRAVCQENDCYQQDNSNPEEYSNGCSAFLT
jgi:hypothetical protein